MKKVLILLMIFSGIMFGNDDKKIVKYDPNSWQNGTFITKTEWAKKVTQPKDCGGYGGIEKKLYDILTIGRELMHEDPAIWLDGKYLKFVNSKCNIGTLASSAKYMTKEEFEGIVSETELEKLFKSFDQILALLIFAAPFIILANSRMRKPFSWDYYNGGMSRD